LIVQGIEVCQFVADKVGMFIHSHCVGIGYMSEGQLTAGVCYERYTGKSVMVHQRIDKPPPRGFWYATVDYIYNTLGCSHSIGLVDSTNLKAQKINKKMGFEIESVIKDAGTEGGDLLIMIMRKENCKLLKWSKNEK
jgi:hypothetical protein